MFIYGVEHDTKDYHANNGTDGHDGHVETVNITTDSRNAFGHIDFPRSMATTRYSQPCKKKSESFCLLHHYSLTSPGFPPTRAETSCYHRADLLCCFTT